MKINDYECKMCGECCKNVPCELVPEDLPILLSRFEMSFKEFFKKYLIAVPCNTGDKADTILRLSPVRAKDGERFKTYLEDTDYMEAIDKGGECIFLKDNKCIIHDIKPLGGRIMKCAKMTGGLTLQFTTAQYFIYWYNNQQIFYELSKEVEEVLKEAENLYAKADKCYEDYVKLNDDKKIDEYKAYVSKADKLMNNRLKVVLNEI